MVEEILIIGGSSFIGLHLAKSLINSDKNVTILCRNTEVFNNLDDDFIKNIKVVEGDITDFNTVKENIRDKDFIINLAAVINKGDKIIDPFMDLNVNCIGQLNVLEACKQENPEAKIIWLGSRSQFGIIDKKEFLDENYEQKPISLYGIHKQTAENYCLFYNKAFGLKTIILRPSSVYGPPVATDNDKSVINKFIKKALNDETLPVFGGGEDFKNYTYIKDLIDAMVSVMKSNIDHEVFNIGSSDNYKFVDICNTLVELCGAGKIENIDFTENQLKFDERNTCMDITKIKKQIGWEPKIGIKEGIKRTIDYYKNNKNN